MDLPNHPRRAHYVVGGGIQVVFGKVVVLHEGVVTSRLQIVGTHHHGEALAQ